VNEVVIVRSRKFYPGERRDRTLDRFSRVPKTIASAQTTFQAVQYAQEPARPVVEPSSPVRLVFGFIAVAVAGIIALMLIFGGSPGGVLFGTSQSKRVMLAGFTALVVAVFLIAANPRARGKAVFGALLAAAALLGLPFVFTDGNQPVASLGTRFDDLEPFEPDQPATGDPLPVEDEFAALKEEMDYAPMEREILRYGKEAGDSGRGVIGLWLRGLQERHKFQVRDFVIRNTGADFGSHMYQREGGYLMVISGVSEDFAELARLCQRFGEARIIEPLRVVEVQVDNSAFVEGPLDKLIDPANPAFYELNRRELDSIDLERAQKAVTRLVAAEPKLYRDDIVRRMKELMGEGDVKVQEVTARALLNWGQPGDGSEEVVRSAVAKIAATGKEVPETMVQLLVSRGDTLAIPIIDDLWAQDSTRWEAHYGTMGPAIEDAVLARFEKGSITLQMSAVRLLHRVGTAKSVPVLEEAKESAPPELKVLIDRALVAVRARGS
jgi:hypothetical protein